MRFGLVGPSYTNRSTAVSDEECINYFYQSDESGNGQSRASYYWTPGMKLFCNTLGAKTRGGIELNGRMFSVVDGVFFEISSAGVATNRGSVISDGKPVSMAKTSTQILVISAGHTYCFTLATNNFTDQTANMLGTPAMCEATDTYFLVTLAGSNKWQFSDLLNGESWPGTNVIEISVFAGNIVSLKESHREITVLGERYGVVYYDSGSDNVFDVVSSSKMEHGNAAAFSHTKVDNTDYWIVKDENGAAWAAKLAGSYTPQRISTYAVEEAWAQYSTISDAEAYVCQIDGHTFWRIYFPTANATWAYDIGEGIWHKLGFWNGGSYDAHHSHWHVFAFGKHLVGDWASGKIYELSMAYYDDDGAAIRRLIRTPTLGNELQWDIHDRLVVDVDAGQGPTPPLSGTPDPLYYPSRLIVADQLGNQYVLQVDNLGDILLTPTSGLTPIPLYVNDQTTGKTLEIKVVSSGGTPNLVPTPTFSSSNVPKTLQMSTSDATQATGIQVANGILQTVQAYSVPRGPILMMRFSNDRGRNWSNEQQRDCGQVGQFTKRIVFYRLGKFRTRIYEISMTDPVPWVIIDGYIDIPEERLVSKMRAQA